MVLDISPALEPVSEEILETGINGVGLALVFSSYRIIPAAITFWGYENPFMYGFPSFSVLWSALISIYQSQGIILDMTYTK